MSRNDKDPTPAVKAAIGRAVNYELTIADLAKRSERRAWQVAATAIVLCLILAGGYFMLLPLKERTPFIVMADPYTGNVQASRLVPDVMDRQITGNEALTRANVDRYVLARESFDVEQFGGALGGWRQVNLMSSAPVAQAYRLLYDKNNPASPAALYGRGAALRVRLLSTVLVRSGKGEFRGATVRFQRFIYDKKSGATQPLDNKLATLEFEHRHDLKFDDRDRDLNPLGFQVVSYR
ncbi:MAG: type IV secretion system protein, partial [Pseudomonas sp.]